MFWPNDGVTNHGAAGTVFIGKVGSTIYGLSQLAFIDQVWRFCRLLRDSLDRMASHPRLSLPMRLYRVRLARSKGRKRALVAIARNLAVILHAMWIDDPFFLISGQMRHHDLTIPNQRFPARTVRLRGRGLDEAANVCCAAPSVPQSEALLPRSDQCLWLPSP